MPPSGLLLGGPYHVLDTRHFLLNFFLTTPRRFYSHFMETKSEFEEVKKFSAILKNKHQLPSLGKKKKGKKRKKISHRAADWSKGSRQGLRPARVTPKLCSFHHGLLLPRSPHRSQQPARIPECTPKDPGLWEGPCQAGLEGMSRLAGSGGNRSDASR